jgi:hypothetical protein
MKFPEAIARKIESFAIIIDKPPDARGKELSCEDMEHLGCSIQRYRIVEAP